MFAIMKTNYYYYENQPVWYKNGRKQSSVFFFFSSDCIKSIRRFYGDELKIHISSGGALMEFSPKSSQSLSQPTTLWNSSVPLKSQQSRGSVKAGHWILEGLTQADQGNYTLRDVNRQPLSTVHLIVEGE